jgi:hypothetical protein
MPGTMRRTFKWIGRDARSKTRIGLAKDVGLGW